jgi:hypothetical protein
VVGKITEYFFVRQKTRPVVLLNTSYPLPHPLSVLPPPPPVLAARLVVNGAYGRGSSPVRPPQFLLVLASNAGFHLGCARVWQAAGYEVGRHRWSMAVEQQLTGD